MKVLIDSLLVNPTYNSGNFFKMWLDTFMLLIFLLRHQNFGYSIDWLQCSELGPRDHSN